ncbi:MAG: polysaccharide biosynthesis protein [Bacteroidota bacterium]
MIKHLNNKSDKFNVFANYGGNILTAVISLIFIPVYIKYLGIESYGVLGFFVTIQGLLAFLDLGLGITINQEMARYYGNAEKTNYLNNLAYSLQIVYWIIGILIALFLFVFTPYFSASWFKESNISRSQLQQCFMLMSVTIAARWPYSIYSSGLRGMQLQVLLNVHDLFYNIIKAVGSWLVLLYIKNSLVAFLTFQLIVILCQTISLHFIFWYKLPKPGIAKKFDKQVLKNIAKYAAAMGAAAILGSFVYQLDKIILSKMLKAEKYGYYTLAFNVAILVNNVTLPIYMAIFPNFTTLVHNNQQTEMKQKFHQYSKLVAGLVMPVSTIIFFFAKELLFAWTKNMELATHVAPILQVLIIATTLNAFMVMPHTLLLANKNVRLMLKSHIIAAVFFVPLILLLTLKYDITGGATALVILYAGYFFIQALIIIKKYNPGQVISWYIKDIGYFILVSVLLIALSKIILPMQGWGRISILTALFAIWCVSTLACLSSIKSIRNIVLQKLKK